MRLSAVALALALAGCCAAPKILSPYRSRLDADGTPRGAEHAGVDFRGRIGDPVLAAADGEVLRVTLNLSGCGIGVLISHAHDRFTVYCHLDRALVRPGERVRRGQVIGRVGTTGNTAGVPHLHLELCTEACPIGHLDGVLSITEDPMAVMQGRFDASRVYPTDRLVLTYPVRCGN
jgi:murein DD-endopeptidase MepM/ murein hydrolase activator NlpD